MSAAFAPYVSSKTKATSKVVFSPAPRLNSVFDTVNCSASEVEIVPVRVPVPLLVIV